MTTMDARAVRRLMRSARKARSTTTLREQIGNGYEILLTVAILGGIGVQAGRRLLTVASTGAPPANANVLAWLLVALTLLLAGLAVRGLVAIGPLVAGPATRTWLLSTPVDRAGLLSVWHLWTLLASAATGLGYGVLIGHLGSAGLVELGLCAGLGLLVGVALTGWSVRRQAGRSAWFGQLAMWLVGGGLLLGLVVGVLRLAGAAPPSVPSPGWLLVAVALAVPLAVVGIWGGARIRGRINRAALAEGAGLAGATVTAASWFDPSLLSGLLTQRRWLRLASVRSTRLRPGSRTMVLLGAELRRVRRSRAAVLTWATLLVVQYTVSAVISPLWTSVVQVVGATLAADRLAGGLRTVGRSAAIRRALGGTDRQLRLVHLVIPASAALVWSALTWPVVWSAGPLLGVLYPAVSAALVIHRMATRRVMDYNLAGTLDPGVGVMPIGLLTQLVRGPDLLFLLAAVRTLF